MFSDPQVVTVLTVGQSLKRVSTGENAATYREPDDNYQLSVSHTYGKRTSRALRLRNRKIAADPFTTGVQKEYTQTVSFVLNTDPLGFTVAEVVGDLIGLCDYVKANTNAIATAWAGGES
jgi:sugar/nucleoside kinase (ribokinase family)